MSKAEKIEAVEIKKSDRKWQSDVIVDMIKRYGFEYIALNPGASYRGLHDSLVNYGENDPPMLLCNHEKIAVQIAHGYARASGKPMIAIVHNLVGLLHAPMGIYYAYLDRAPVFIIGATGPMEEPKRRPFIDWIHSASVQGEAIRHYVKWDSQPTTIDGVPGAFARAYSVMMSGKQGPIYMCYDAGLQEAALDHDVAMPPEDNVHVPAQAMADPAALEKAADTLAAAERPVIVADFAARPPHGWDHVVELAETLGAAVWDCDSRLNFPSEHPLNLSMDSEGCYKDADVVLTLDIADFEKPTHVRDIATRTVVSMVPEDATWIDIGYTDTEISKWAMTYARPFYAHQRMTADPVTAAPALTNLLKERIAATPGRAEQIAKRTEEVGKRHAEIRAEWLRQAKEDRWDAVPMTVPRLALEVWEAIKDEDWVLTSGTLHDWARRLWNFDKPYRHGGRELGTGTQIGISLGVALAHKGTGRLVVDLQPDGDLMFDAGSLWIAAKYQIPMLIVMYNNRAYYNDWNHQIVMARNRGTDPSRAHIGMDLFGPDPDFAGLARSMGWYAEGPIENGDDVKPALERAIEQVKQGKPALVDTVTQRR
ncbi:MAG: thiamine pyrophosphate-binding protein [Deltaproteobacteria bacterium]|nr:thiamine pyrophosphate-binding protein [Deltaproteobacteria bacterium]